MQLMTFTLGSGNFGIPLEDIELIDGRSSGIVEFPATSAYIKGIVTVRGNIVPVYSLALRFGCTEEKLRYFIIVNVGGMKLGFEVDQVNAVIDVEEKEVFPLPQFINGAGDYLRNIISSQQKQMIILIDVNRLMPYEERVEMNRLIEESI